MDPDANLAEQRNLVYVLLAERNTIANSYALGLRLAQLVDALDGWIVANGYLPASWRPDEPELPEREPMDGIRYTPPDYRAIARLLDSRAARKLLDRDPMPIYAPDVLWHDKGEL